jgi:hypothetical protein
LFGEQDEGGVVVDVASGFVEDTIVTMGGVWIEGHIGEDWEVRKLLFQCPEGAGNETFGVQASLAVLRAKRRLDAREDGDPANAAVGQPGRLPKDAGNRIAGMAREAGNRRGLTGAVLNKERSHQVGW